MPSAAAADWRIRLVLSTLMAFAAISTDLYLPALPTVAVALQADPARIQLTIATYLAGFTLGQLLWGPIGDRCGRRLPIAAGTMLFILGAVACTLAQSASQLLAGRIIQALGASAGVVLARAIVRDLYARDRAAQMLSRLMIVMLIAPMIGPTIGGQILALAGWRAIFAVLVAVGLASLLSQRILPETLAPDRRNPAPLHHAFAGFATLLRDPALRACALTIACYYLGTFAYISASPFAYITYYGVAPERYGLLFGTGVGGIMLANMLNARLVVRYGAQRLMRIGTGLTALAGLAIVAAGASGAGGLWGLVLPMFFYTAASGFIVANAMASALAPYPQQAGAVSALVGAIQWAGAILGSTLVASLADGTPRPMAALVALGGLGAALAARRIARRQP